MKSYFGVAKEKIYKFVYKEQGRYGYENPHTVLLTAKDAVAAVKAFNKLCGDRMYDIVEFIVITPKEGGEEDKE